MIEGIGNMNYTNGIIHLLRGDSFTTSIKINLGTKLKPSYYKLKGGDALYFGLMEPNQSFEEAVLKKKYDYSSDTDSEGNVLLKIAPKDTLKLAVGKYYYMVKLKSTDSSGQEYVKTIISPTQFFLEGNNVSTYGDDRYEKGKYAINELVLEGGEIKSLLETPDKIIWDGGVFN